MPQMLLLNGYNNKSVRSFAFALVSFIEKLLLRAKLFHEGCKIAYIILMQETHREV